MTLFALAAGKKGADVGSNLLLALMLQVHSGIPGIQRQSGKDGANIRLRQKEAIEDLLRELKAL